MINFPLDINEAQEKKALPDYECIVIGFRLAAIRNDKRTTKKQYLPAIGVMANHYSLVSEAKGKLKVIIRKTNENKALRCRPKNNMKGDLEPDFRD